MKHYTSSDFWALYRKLPAEIRELADKNYELLKANPQHPSLHFKRIEELGLYGLDSIIVRSVSTQRAEFNGCGSAATPITTRIFLNVHSQNRYKKYGSFMHAAPQQTRSNREKSDFIRRLAFRRRAISPRAGVRQPSALPRARAAESVPSCNRCARIFR